MIEIHSFTPVRLIAPPQFGRQQLGYPSSGPSDQFSASRCQGILGDATLKPIVEWDLIPISIVVHAPCRLVVGGSPRQMMLNGEAVQRYEVLHLETRDRLDLGPARGGTLGYLAMAGGVEQTVDYYFRPISSMEDHSHPRTPQPWSQVGAWAPPKGIIRCLPGPEWQHDLLRLLEGPWQMTKQRDRRGIRLSGPPMPEHMSYDIPPAPLVDGTVQLTRSGPIVLTRDRGTVGGYPRGWVVIDADIDTAVQMPSGLFFAFELITQAEAIAIEQHKAQCLESCHVE